jgi:hypothetical protein
MPACTDIGEPSSTLVFTSFQLQYWFSQPFSSRQRCWSRRFSLHSSVSQRVSFAPNSGTY